MPSSAQDMSGWLHVHRDFDSASGGIASPLREHTKKSQSRHSAASHRSEIAVPTSLANDETRQ